MFFWSVNCCSSDSYSVGCVMFHTTCHVGLAVITCLSGDGLEEAIEQTELIFIMGMWSCSSLHWASMLSAKSKPVSSLFTGVWTLGSGKKNKVRFNFRFRLSALHSLCLRVDLVMRCAFVISYNCTFILNFIMRLHGKSWDWVSDY